MERINLIHEFPNKAIILMHGDIEEIELSHNIPVKIPNTLKEIRAIPLSELIKLPMEDVRYKKVLGYKPDLVVHLVKEV